MSEKEKVKIKLVPREDGEKQVIIFAEFGLGTLNVEKEGLIAIPIGVGYALWALEQSIVRTAGEMSKKTKKAEEHYEENEKKLQELLQEYAHVHLLKMLGVAHSPIGQRKDGKISGFEPNKEVVIIEENV